MYVHLMEMSPHPERALRASDQLRDLVPDAGHLRHMPTHIDVLCGHYRDVVLEICSIIDGPVSAECLAQDADGLGRLLARNPSLATATEDWSPVEGFESRHRFTIGRRHGVGSPRERPWWWWPLAGWRRTFNGNGVSRVSGSRLFHWRQ